MNNFHFVDRNATLSRVGPLRGLLARLDSAVAKSVDEAIAKLKEDQFRITVLGKAKRGKSTLINAWLGRNDDVVAPIDKLPATSVITEIAWPNLRSASFNLATVVRQRSVQPNWGLHNRGAQSGEWQGCQHLERSRPFCGTGA